MSFVNTKKALDAKKAEEQYKDLKQFNISDTVKTSMRTVKVAGVPVGVVYNDEDEQRLLDALHHYGQNLLTPNDVYVALRKMYGHLKVAEDLREAKMAPEQELTIDGRTVLMIDGNLYTTDGTKIND